jgi:hypothetical protein
MSELTPRPHRCLSLRLAAVAVVAAAITGWLIARLADVMAWNIGWLLLLALVVATPAVEVPDWCLRGIAQVETNSDWRDIGSITYRDQRLGAIGEVGPWQLSPDVLHDLGVASKAARIHRDVIYAESLTRAWLLRCYARTGSWIEAVAIYHVGSAGDLATGRLYAQQVSAVGRK